MAGLRWILALACVGVLAVQAVGYKRCSYASWGRKTDIVDAEHKPDIDVGNFNALVNVYNRVGYDLVGMEVIVCDWFEEPLVTFTDERHVVVTRNYAAGPATLVAITFSEPLYPVHPAVTMSGPKLGMRGRQGKLDLPIFLKGKPQH